MKIKFDFRHPYKRKIKKYVINFNAEDIRWMISMIDQHLFDLFIMKKKKEGKVLKEIYYKNPKGMSLLAEARRFSKGIMKERKKRSSKLRETLIKNNGRN